MIKVPKIAAINDLSGVGRCSLTVILPILSALGCQVCPLPTALLSHHSEYKDFYFYDFTNHIKEYYSFWQKNNEVFDCVYSGFLGSEKQIDIIIDIINDTKNKNNKAKIIVDPVMGDSGVIYSTYTEQMINKMYKLVNNADIITPNLTEASILLEVKYETNNITIETLKDYLKKLSNMGPNTVVITGIKITDSEHMNICYDKNKDKYWKVPYKHIDIRYPGTGDLFSALFLGYLFNKRELPEAVEDASKFISSAVSKTYEANTLRSEGAMFESIMEELYIKTEKYKYSAI